MAEKETEISRLGEFGLIDRLTADLPKTNASTIRAVGDDAAVLRYPDTDILVTTDLLLEGVHFDFTYMQPKLLGYKAAIVNFSDIYAMNGTRGRSPCRSASPNASPSSTSTNSTKASARLAKSTASTS